MACQFLTRRAAGPCGMLLNAGAWQRTSRTQRASSRCETAAPSNHAQATRPDIASCVCHLHDPDRSGSDRLDFRGLCSSLTAGLNTPQSLHAAWRVDSEAESFGVRDGCEPFGTRRGALGAGSLSELDRPPG